MHLRGTAGMSERRGAQNNLRDIREALESVLHALDMAELHLVAAHVHMALVALDKVQTLRPDERIRSDIA